MKKILEPSWQELLNDEFKKKYFVDLEKFVDQQYSQFKIFPPQEHIFRAFELCPFDKIKVVILGQDPYHGENQANGLCFSVENSVKTPPSLKNIFKEIERTNCSTAPQSNDLSRWASQGVLLLNSVLTVRAHEAASHSKQGWEEFTNAIIELIAKRRPGVVYMLWGNYAQKKAKFVDETKNLVLRSVHPSPLSARRGFVGSDTKAGCDHFRQANDYLKKNNLSPINW